MRALNFFNRRSYFCSAIVSEPAQGEQQTTRRGLFCLVNVGCRAPPLVARLEGEAVLSALATRAASIMGEAVYRDSSSLRALSSLPGGCREEIAAMRGGGQQMPAAWSGCYNNRLPEFCHTGRLCHAILLVIAEQCEDVFGLHSSPDQIALDFVAIGLAQVIQLRRAFNAFCNNADLEVPSQCDDGFHDGSAIRLHQHVTNKDWSILMRLNGSLRR
jgi:hypothetical protein